MDYKYDKFENFIKDIEIGYDIEFTYNNKKYSICNTPLGRSAGEQWKDYKTTEQLVDNWTIDGKKLEEIWQDIIIDSL